MKFLLFSILFLSLNAFAAGKQIVLFCDNNIRDFEDRPFKIATTALYKDFETGEVEAHITLVDKDDKSMLLLGKGVQIEPKDELDVYRASQGFTKPKTKDQEEVFYDGYMLLLTSKVNSIMILKGILGEDVNLNADFRNCR